MDVEIPDELKYTKTHEYVRVEGDVATVGISDHAQCQLGDIVYVELPSVGESVEQGTVTGEIESVKAVGEFYMPVTGKVVEVNAQIGESPGLVNTAPYGDGWFVKVKMADPSQLDALLSSTEYAKVVEAELHEH